MIARSIGELISQHVHATVAPNTTMDAVCHLFKSHDFGAIPVVYSGRLVGMIKRRDTTIQQFQTEEVLMGQFACDYMTPVATSVTLNSSLLTAIGTMMDFCVDHLPVLDRAGDVVGLLSFNDIPQEYQILVEQLRGSRAAIPAE